MSGRLFLLALSGLLAVAVVQAEVYRWVDEQGKSHFSDRPRDGGAQKLEFSESRSRPDGKDRNSLEAERMEQQQRLLDAYREDREARHQDRVEAEAAERKRSNNCAYARSRLRQYKSSRLYQPLEDGGRRYLSRDEQQREIDRTRADVQHWCDS